MLLIDTHIWVWWQTESKELSTQNSRLIESYETIALSRISIWEVAKLVEKNRLKFTIPIEDWLKIALSEPQLKIVPLDTNIIIESTQLPDEFHKDPADQLIVATARILEIPLLTEDGKILAYPHYPKP